MQLGELLSSLLVNLQSLMKTEVNLGRASFPKIIALSIIPPDGLEMSALAKRIGIDNSTATRLVVGMEIAGWVNSCLLYTSPSPRDRQKSRMPSSA